MGGLGELTDNQVLTIWSTIAPDDKERYLGELQDANISGSNKNIRAGARERSPKTGGDPAEVQV